MPLMHLDAIEALASSALAGAGASPFAAAAVARSIRLAERDGIRSHGLLYLPIYLEHLGCGKVLRDAEATVTTPRPALVCVDAGNGFAHAGIDAGWPAFVDAARSQGVAVLTLHRSYNCGVLGHHAERLAADGLLGLCTTHAPASIAPPGGQQPLIGTNPFALAVPDGQGGARFVIDQSASVVARSELLLRAREARPLEPGWALDADGQPTTDATAALAGSMLPAGGVKGFGMGLLVEVLASALAGAVGSRDASAFSGPVGGPPATGQCFIAIDPDAAGTGRFHAAIDGLVAAIAAQPGARLPGSRRVANRQRTATEGVAVDDALLARIAAAASAAAAVESAR